MWRTTLICLFAIASRESFGTKQLDPTEFQNIRGITGGNKICTVKGTIHSYICIKKFLGFMHKIMFDFSAAICGDQCIDGNAWFSSGGICKCGHESFRTHSDPLYYCCIKEGDKCTKSNGNVVCPNGKKLQVSQPCNGHCPVSLDHTEIVVFSACTSKNLQCPKVEVISKICTAPNITSSEVHHFCQQNGKKICPEKDSFSKHPIRQCFDNK